MPSEYSGNELFPGSLRGYRAWSLDYNYLVLHAINSGYGGWEPGVNKAGCTVGTSQYNYVKHTVPNKDHTCGFYCRYDPDDLDGIVSSSAAIFGAVDVHGKLILGTRGLRAEYAEIVALTYENCEINKRIIDLYAERYEIPVFETMEKLIAEYPRSDVSDLIPEEKPVEQSNFTDLRQLYLNDFGDAMKRLWVALPPSTGTPVYRPNEHVTWWTNTTTNTAAYGVGGGMTMSVDDSPIITIASGGDGGGYYISPQDSTWHLNYESE